MTFYIFIIKNLTQLIFFWCFIVLMYVYYGFVIESPLLYGQDLQYRPWSYVDQITTYIPQLWESYRYGGYSNVSGGVLANSPIHYAAVHLSKLTGIHYNNIGIRIFWFVPFFLFALLGIYKLFKEEDIDIRYFFIVTSFYLCNPAIVSRIYRGQLGLMVGYSLIPLIFVYTKKAIINFRFDTLLIYSLIITLSIAYDIRITILSLIVALVVYLRSIDFSIALKIFIVFGVLLSLNSYWVFPTIDRLDLLVPLSLQKEGIINQNSYLAGNIINVLSLEPKIWGNNLFPVSLALLILIFYFFFRGFSTSQNLTKSQATIIATLLVLIFLGKGGSPPFGDIYNMIMTNIPIANMFRVPYKFWLLIPVVVILMAKPVLKRPVEKKKLVIVAVFSLFYLLSSGHSFLNLYFNKFNNDYLKIGGYPIHVNKDIPHEYEKTWSYIKSTGANKVLWLPDYFTYSFADNTTSSLFLRAFYRNPLIAEKIKNSLDNNEFEILTNYLGEYNISAVVILDGFRNSSYDLYDKLRFSKFFNRGYVSENSAVFLVKNPKNMIRIDGVENSTLVYNKVSDTHYEISIPNQCADNRLIFASSFDNYWLLDGNESSEYMQGINSFILNPEMCGNSVSLYYKGQDLFEYSIRVSFFSLLLIILYFLGRLLSSIMRNQSIKP